jgi:hypothetical protein
MRPVRSLVRMVMCAALAAGFASCRASTKPGSKSPSPTAARVQSAKGATASTTTTQFGVVSPSTSPGLHGLGPPPPLVPFATSSNEEGVWRPAGRLVDGEPAVYETTLTPPGGTQPAGIAWMDTGLLAARLYSGSESPGGGPYLYSAPIRPAAATTLVAAFNGGFKMAEAGGGYYTESRMLYPLRAGAASLVIYANGTIDIGAWGSDVSMTPSVTSVRQNLVPLVEGGQPTAAASAPDWSSWGNTCGATSCAHSVPGVEHQWRSGVGITASGALVYVTGPSLAPVQLARLLVRAGAQRGMELDINPSWTVFVTYSPPTAGGLASPANGQKLLSATMQGPATFFESWWARDFVTMSSR